MSKVSVDHASEGKRYLEEGLQLIKNGDVDNAIEAFFHAAVEFERGQDFRQILALWKGVAKLLELKNKGQENVPPISERWPLEYSTIKLDEWEKQKNPLHRLAWVYQWAAEHRETNGDLDGAFRNFLRAAEAAEQTKIGKKYPDWPAKLWYRAIYNHIRVFGTIDDEKTREAIKKMENNYLQIEDKAKACRSLATSYRLLKSNLMGAGNLTEAEEFKRKERSALMRYYFHNGSYFRAIAEWLSGSGFLYFIIVLFLMILVVFPYIYYQWDLIISVQGKITYPDAILYSIESALNSEHNEFYAVGGGKILNIFEAALSWLGLGVFIWWLTRRLE